MRGVSKTNGQNNPFDRRRAEKRDIHRHTVLSRIVATNVLSSTGRVIERLILSQQFYICSRSPFLIEDYGV
jgi:hypothetical protein